MEIIQASSYDLIDVLFLLKQCILDMNRRGFKQWNSAYPGQDVIRNDIERGTLYICKEQYIAKGMINLSDEKPEEYSEIKWNANMGKVLYIKRFAVHPFWKESDISARLMDYAEDFAKKNKYTCIQLDVLDSFPADNKLFSGRNYQLAGSFHSAFQKLPYSCYEKNL